MRWESIASPLRVFDPALMMGNTVNLKNYHFGLLLGYVVFGKTYFYLSCN